jgi:hypothetical protein
VRLRNHARFGHLEVGWIAENVAERRITGLFELHKFSLHLRAREWDVRLRERGDRGCKRGGGNDDSNLNDDPAASFPLSRNTIQSIVNNHQSADPMP